MSIRLNKFIADSTGLSRRKADALIESGQVRVNGKPATVGMVLETGNEHVTVNGERIVPQRKRYVAFYKPKGVLTTRSDPEGRKTIYDLLPESFQDLDPSGRLDRDSTGLLILSNDGNFLQRLMHPRYRHSKTYRVKVRPALTPDVLRQLEQGIMLEPEHQLAKCQVKDILETDTVVLVLKTGLNRQIRRSFEALRYEVVQLKRTAIGTVTLGNLKPGQARLLKPGEIMALSRS